MFKNFKQRPSKLRKGYSQDLVKQTVTLRIGAKRRRMSDISECMNACVNSFSQYKVLGHTVHRFFAP